MSYHRLIGLNIKFRSNILYCPNINVSWLTLTVVSEHFKREARIEVSTEQAVHTLSDSNQYINSNSFPYYCTKSDRERKY